MRILQISLASRTALRAAGRLVTRYEVYAPSEDDYRALVWNPGYGRHLFGRERGLSVRQLHEAVTDCLTVNIPRPLI